MGRHIENFRRTQKFDSVLGGEESGKLERSSKVGRHLADDRFAVLLDLGVRQALKKMPKDARL